MPHEPDHPRADALCFKLQLSALQPLERPIFSLRCRRISFIHTTWGRFVDAKEIIDLLVQGEPYVDRLYYALREAGIFPEQGYRVCEAGVWFRADLAVPCREGTVSVTVGDRPVPSTTLRLTPTQVARDTAGCASVVADLVRQKGGARPTKRPPPAGMSAADAS